MCSQVKSRWWFREVNPICGACCASSAIRCCRVDTESAPGIAAMFPSSGSLTRGPLPCPGSGPGSPVRLASRYYEAFRPLSAHRSKLIGFAEDLPPCASDEFAPTRLAGDRRARVLVDRLTRGAEQTAGTDRPPRFLGNPEVTAPTSKDPGGTALPGQYGRAGAAPTCAHGRGSRDET